MISNKLIDLQEIQKENETYYSLLREALPPGPARFAKYKKFANFLLFCKNDFKSQFIQGGGVQPEPEACVGRKNLGASSQCGQRYYLSQSGCKSLQNLKRSIVFYC